MTNQQNNGHYTLFDHLLELRNRLLKAILCVLILFLPLAYFSEPLYLFLSQPLVAVLPEGTQMIATDVASPFFTQIKLAIVAAIFLAIPYILYQVWAFIAPGLYQNEKKLIAPLMFGSSLLFYFGVAFAYYVVFPLAFNFFTNAAPEGVAIATDISNYLDFVLKLFFAFGFAFEIPIIIILMVWTGATTVESLKIKRPYIIVTAFVVGMLLTPPDPISQTMLAVPMLLLFELGLLIAGLYQAKDESQETEEGS
ncbi:twin-arginine translocase subunit TatC [Thalassotalea agarivorans]|uniref:Sec-independent protein translocase protein TatC n=1 Tax=Thalassotalea agarivorans TaxID=349064 RepID=A0A1I0EAD5_THASX|nr:twin-arginine translocase subunit TatC [Thalassotalea agarivorans]SET42005.1 Sec-independent protein translocase TatC [Thalassotalea agarivorans]